MGMRNNAKMGKVSCFGPFCLRTTTRVLLKDGDPVPLGSRAFDLLVTLVAHAGQVLSRHDLLERAWPDVTVQDSNLRVQIANLRKVLGRQENGNHYIATVAVRGYSFVADVRHCTDPDIEASASPRISEPCKLPPRLSRMIGRETAVAALTSMLVSKGFVSIVGTGGIGKTTVAIAIAHGLLEAFDNSVYFVDLGSLTDPDLVGLAIASTVGCSVYNQDPLPALIGFLANRRHLLVLDNCEHLMEAVAGVAERLVNEIPSLSILTTSREPLRVDGEHVYLLLPLDMPSETAELTSSQLLMSPAVQLFAERASASGYRDDFGDADAKIIAEICRKLDGVPLAIELAASRSGLHGIRQTAKLLDDRFSLLWQGRRDALPRHQTLQAMIDWSYDLLSKQEQEMLRWLSIFSGAFTLSAALFISSREERDGAQSAEIIASLVNRSLIWVTNADGETFYRLPETTRAYALGMLGESGDRDGVARRHALYYARHLTSDDTEAVGGRNTSTRSIHLGNIRAALNWAFSEKGQIEIGIELCVRAAPLFLSLSFLDECLRWSRRSLKALPPPMRGTKYELALQEALAISSMFALGNGNEVRFAIDRGLDLAYTLKDTRYQLRLLAGLNIFLIRIGDFRSALDAAERSKEIAEGEGDTSAIVASEWMLGVSHHLLGDQVLAQEHCERGFKIADRAETIHVNCFGYDHRVRALVALARALWLRGSLGRALEISLQAIEEAALGGHPVSICISHIYTIPIFLWAGDFDRAESHIEMLIAQAGKYALEPYHAVGFALKGTALIARGDLLSAVDLLREASSKFERERHRVLATVFNRILAEGLVRVGQWDEAMRIMDIEVANTKQVGETIFSSSLLRAQGAIILEASEPNLEMAEEALVRAIDIARKQSATVLEIRAAIPLAKLWARQGRRADAGDMLAEMLPKFDGISAADVREAKRLLVELR